MDAMAWSDDQLDRKTAGEFLKNYLVNRYKDDNHSFILNINTEWGFGKTYFLKNLALQLENEKYPVIYIDAWESDFSDEPLLAIISEIDDQLEPFFSNSNKAKGLVRKTVSSAKKLVKPSLPLLASILLKKLTGYSFDELSEQINDDDLEKFSDDAKEVVSTVITKAAQEALVNHKNTKEGIIEFKNNLNKLINYIKNNIKAINLPLYIFIDELDRCRPNYAIELLENIKHLFGVSSVYFIIATDSKQLSHSIKSVYGAEFESMVYLKRFFDQEYILPNPDRYKYTDFIFKKLNIDKYNNLFSPFGTKYITAETPVSDLFAKLAVLFKLSLRDIEQCLNTLKTIVLVNSSLTIQAGYLFFLLMLKQKNDYFYNDFVTTEGYRKKEIISELDKNKIFGENSKFISQRRIDGAFGEAREEEFSITDIIYSYVDLLDKNIEKIRQSKSNKSYEINIQNSITTSAPTSYPSHQVPEHNLNIYPALVSQAGQII